MSWFLKGLKQYADFRGRARRQEYWMFTLFSFILGAILYSLLFIGIAMDSMGMIVFGLILFIIYVLALFVPTLAVTVRRLHDTGRSGVWYFINFVPFAGGIILLVFCCLDSENGNNQWGTNPKNSGSAIEAI
ncbi:DUF805 domain-containing protein [Rossellomorea marisflavi]|uniref:Uncharacterized protein n=1 Tax=Rossellomorea marisflavi TaxID=189381 RepID=A0A0J5SJ61_9BACI|nr:DUF805 domain-containing protein [Rossellomorea marisflavi]VXB03156.1 conserved hypothetical protein; putative inner membrane protein [Bacillus sp. 349Y]KMK97235.1 membrane protein [Rossellomorea marisflavi]KML06813.1 membrane protein [Rossellomorea marisflavi]KML35402.1 membrane protein [Rossellomorea marisflavi]KZE45262.1 hypothetical protein AV649_03435 [Rossellomorea marisflavi]